MAESLTIMNVDPQDFLRAALSEGLTQQQAASLWRRLESQAVPETKAPASKFDFVHLFYYFGAMMVIGAFGWFMTKAWDSFGGVGLALIAVSYAVAFVLAGRSLWEKQLRTPGGLLIVLAVCMTPLAVFGLQNAIGWWPKDDPGSYTNYHPLINGSWVVMELATVLVGWLAVRRWPFPFIVAPIAHALWFMSMDAAELMSRGDWSGWEQRLVISALFGGVMIVVGYIIDLRGRSDDFAFWFYLFGLMALWGSLSSMNSHSEFNAFLYGVLNLAFIVAAIVLQRRTFMVFGSLGVFGYLGHLTHKVFADSILFPFMLCLFGVAVMALGIWYQRHRRVIESRLRAAILPTFGHWLPARTRVMPND